MDASQPFPSHAVAMSGVAVVGAARRAISGVPSMG
jgi:hypothetical protein